MPFFRTRTAAIGGNPARHGPHIAHKAHQGIEQDKTDDNRRHQQIQGKIDALVAQHDQYVTIVDTPKYRQGSRQDKQQSQPD